MAGYDGRITERKEDTATAHWIDQLMPAPSTCYLVIKLEPNQRSRTQSYLRALQTDASALRGTCQPVSLSYFPIFKIEGDFVPQSTSLDRLGLSEGDLRLPYYIGFENWRKSDDFLETSLVIGQNLLEFARQLLGRNSFSACPGIKVMKITHLPYNPGMEADFIASMKARPFTLPVRYPQLTIMTATENLKLRLEGNRLDFGVSLRGALGARDVRLPALPQRTGGHINQLLDASRTLAYNSQKLTPLARDRRSDQTGISVDGTEGRGRVDANLSRHVLIGPLHQPQLSLKDQVKSMQQQARSENFNARERDRPLDGNNHAPETTSILRVILNRVIQDLQCSADQASEIGQRVIGECSSLGLLDEDGSCPPATELLRRVNLFAQGAPDPERPVLFNKFMFHALPADMQPRFAELVATSSSMPADVRRTLLREIHYSHLIDSDMMEVSSANGLQFHAQHPGRQHATLRQPETELDAGQHPGPRAEQTPAPDRRTFASGDQRTSEQLRHLQEVQERLRQYKARSDVACDPGTASNAQPRLRAVERTLATEHLTDEALLAPLVGFEGRDNPSDHELAFFFRCARELSIRQTAGVFISPSSEISQRLLENQQIQAHGYRITGQSPGSTTSELLQQVMEAESGEVTRFLEETGFPAQVYVCAGFTSRALDNFVRDLCVNDFNVLITMFFFPSLAHALIAREIQRTAEKGQVRQWGSPVRSRDLQDTGLSRQTQRSVQEQVTRFHEQVANHRRVTHRALSRVMRERNRGAPEEYKLICQQLEEGLVDTYEVLAEIEDEGDWKERQLQKGGSVLKSAPRRSDPDQRQDDSPQQNQAAAVTTSGPTPVTTTTASTARVTSSRTESRGVFIHAEPGARPTVPLLPNINPLASRTQVIDDTVPLHESDNQNDERSDGGSDFESSTGGMPGHNTTVVRAAVVRGNEPQNDVMLLSCSQDLQFRADRDVRASTHVSTRDRNPAPTTSVPDLSPILTPHQARTSLRQTETRGADFALTGPLTDPNSAVVVTGDTSSDISVPRNSIIITTPEKAATSLKKLTGPSAPSVISSFMSFAPDISRFLRSRTSTSAAISDQSLTQSLAAMTVSGAAPQPSLTHMSDGDLNDLTARISRDTVSFMSDTLSGSRSDADSAIGEVMLRDPVTGIEHSNRSAGTSLIAPAMNRVANEGGAKPKITAATEPRRAAPAQRSLTIENTII